jgi:hypothetical protein
VKRRQTKSQKTATFGGAAALHRCASTGFKAVRGACLVATHALGVWRQRFNDP